MSPARATFSRTVGRLRAQCSTAFSVGAFMCVSAVMFAFALLNAEGGSTPLAAVWAASVSPVLPALATLLAMDVWSDERHSGRMDMLLSAPVRERDYAIGKFLGCWAVLAAAVAVCLAASVACLWAFAPSALARTRPAEVLPADGILAPQGALWCAVAAALSSVFRSSAASAVASLVATVALPRGLWAAWTAWSDPGRTAFGEMPLDAHVADFSSGMASIGVVVFYLATTAFFVFAATKSAASCRMVGRGASGARAGAASSVALAAVFTALAVFLVFRLDTAVEIPLGDSAKAFSPRTRSILADAGQLSVTCFMRRSDQRFRPVCRFLRQLVREAKSAGGTRVDIKYVDPVWDVGAAERLARSGVEDGSLVFAYGRRTAVLSLKEGWGERACASTIRRLMTPPARRSVYWTTGHGEASFEGYGAFGMSDVGRDLSREG